MSTVARHRRRRLRRQPRRQGARRPPATTSSCTTTCRPATPKRSSGWPRRFPARSIALVDGRHPRRARRSARRCDRRARRPSCTSRRGCWSASRCASRSATIAPTSTGTLSVLGAMAEAGVKRFVFSSTCATFGEPTATPIDETHPQRPINAYGETKLAIERALPHVERAHGIRVGRAALLQCRRRRSRRPHRRRPRSGGAPDSAGDCGAAGRGAADGLRRRLPDAGRHLHPRLRARARPGRRARRGAAAARGRRRVGALQSRHRRPACPCARCIDAVARSPAGRCRTRSARRRPGDPARLVASNERARRELGWEPRLGALRRSSTPPGGGTNAIRRATADRAARSSERIPAPAALRRAVRGRLIVALAAMMVYAAGSVVLACAHQADSRRRPGRPDPAFGASLALILVAYFLKGVGGYVSGYLMADVGQRVVMDLRHRLFRHISRPVGGVLLAAHVGPAGVADHERRQPGAAGGLGDRAGSASRVAGARRLRRAICSTSTGAWRSSA